MRPKFYAIVDGERVELPPASASGRETGKAWRKALGKAGAKAVAPKAAKVPKKKASKK